MSEKYVNVLIPKARRIYLPQIGSFQKLTVKYIGERNGEEKIFGKRKNNRILLRR